MAKPITRQDLDEAIHASEDRLRAEISKVDSGLRAEIGKVESGLRAEIGKVESGLRAEIRRTEERLTYQIGDAVARTANAVVEQLSELIKPVDNKASHALAEARGVRAELAEHAANPDAHRR
jgi:hypothetical protein